jgi:hypothetical protein
MVAMMPVVAVMVVSAAVVPAAVMHLFSIRHGVRRGAEPRCKRHRRSKLRRREGDRGSGQRRQNEFSHVYPSVAANPRRPASP